MTQRPDVPDQEVKPPAPWHTLTREQVEQTLGTGPPGLQEAEAKRRIALYDPNRLAPPKNRGVLMRLLLQSHNILLYVMLGAALITAILGRWVDTGVLMAAVLINAVIGFIQEGKAEAALAAIRAMLSPVIRNGRRSDIEAAGLVPGDLVFVASGDKIPAEH